jgi:hypothetical protein
VTARDAWGQVAHDLRILADSIDAAIDTPSREAAVPESVPAASAAGAPPSPAAPLPPRRQPPDESAFTKCPAHNKEWVDGRYGKFCPAQSDDFPNWANDKGYCKVTPRSASAWLRQHPSAA